jgi:hypothetical protein
MNQVKVERARIAIALRNRVIVLLVAVCAGCASKPRTTPEMVKKRILERNVIGMSPPDVLQATRGMKFDGDLLLVTGPYLRDLRRIEFTIPMVRTSWLTNWSVNGSIDFDTAGRAQSVSAAFSANNPL